MKPFIFFVGVLVGAFVFVTFVHAGGHEYDHTPITKPYPPPPSKPIDIPTQPVVIPVIAPVTQNPAPTATPAPQTTNTPQTPSSPGGGWNGGCSTYPKEITPPWGVVPCVPKSPTQPKAVTPESLQPKFIKLSDLPNTGAPVSEVVLLSLIGAAGLTLLCAKLRAELINP